MIKYLKPRDAKLHLKYECPSCKSEHWATQMEVQQDNHSWKCWCGQLNYVTPIKRFNLQYVVKENSMEKQAQRMLSKYGLNNQNVRHLIQTILSEEPNIQKEALIKQVLQKV